MRGYLAFCWSKKFEYKSGCKWNRENRSWRGDCEWCLWNEEDEEIILLDDEDEEIGDIWISEF